MTLYEKLKKAKKDKFILKSVDEKTLQELVQLEIEAKIEINMQGPHAEITMLEIIEDIPKPKIYVNGLKGFKKNSIARGKYNDVEGFRCYLSEDKVYEVLKYVKKGFVFAEIVNITGVSKATIQRIKKHFNSIAKGEANGICRE